jgi:hypothetical protein
MSERIRSALFVDFDNIFAGLVDLDPTAATAFAEHPQGWMERLASVGLAGGGRRDFLVRRCYLNPSGFRPNPQQPLERLYFSRFRPFLTRAGFEVVDCPSLTRSHKNAADIRLVLDVLDTLQHPTHYDEVVLFSGDADFTPLLQRLRAHDRRTMVASSNQTATAYRGIADTFLDEQALIDLVLDVEVDEGTGTAHPEAIGDGEVGELRRRAVALATETVARSPVAVNLADLGTRIRAELGQAVTYTKWFGAGTLTNAISGPETSDLRITKYHIWDPERHEPPATDPDGDPADRVDLPGVVDRVARVTAMPRLSEEDYRALFAALADHVASAPFNLTEITRVVRDRLAGEGHSVPRQAITFVVRGTLYGGAPLNAVPPPAAPDIARGFFRSVLQAAATAQLALTGEERQEVQAWLSAPPD